MRSPYFLRDIQNPSVHRKYRVATDYKHRCRSLQEPIFYILPNGQYYFLNLTLSIYGIHNTKPVVRFDVPTKLFYPVDEIASFFGISQSK